MPKANATGAGAEGTPFTVPADLSSLSVEQLDELRTQADAEVDAILEAGRRVEDLPRLTQIAKGVKAISARKGEIEAEAADTEAKFQEILDDLRPPQTEPEEPTTDDGDGSSDIVEGEIVDDKPPTATAQPPQMVTAASRPTGGAKTAARDLGGFKSTPKLNPSLSSARQFAPSAEPPKAELAITASVGLPGAFEPGAKLTGIRQLGEVAENRARSMADQGGRYRPRREDDPYGGMQIAQIKNSFETTFDPNTSPDVVGAYLDKLRSQGSAANMETLVAGGGWCAPLTPRYDFFNIACEDGTIDLPTFGAERGGVNFPVSPSLADTFSPALPWYTAFSNATVPWLWTNTDDILTVTGAPNKPCIRVPCSTMTPVQLECYGICLTAGNLADNAWPESTRNFLRLLMAAHYHAANGRYISQISTLATQITGCTAAGSGAAAPILSTAELGAIDYRTKFGMCDSDVIEWIFPAWAVGAIRADLAKRTGVDLLNVSDAMITSWFDTRGIRVQWVKDYQVRAAGQPGAQTAITQYPSFVKGLMYAAGTVVRGNGMTLDLGVVRDSTLNAENDFTAAWMEECHLIARFGHEVREYTINICPDGTTGAADLTSCCP